MAPMPPLEFGQILDGALVMFRRHFGLFCKLSLAVMWLPIALAVYWKLRFFGLQANSLEDAALVQSELVSFTFWGLAFGILYGLGVLLLTAGSIRIISDSYLEREPQFGDALGLGFAKIGPMFLVWLGKTLLMSLLLIIGIAVVAISIFMTRPVLPLTVIVVLVEVVVGVWGLIHVATGYMLTSPIVVLESLPSAFDAFGRSWELIRGARGRIFGLVLVAGLISNVLPSLVMTAMGQLVLELFPIALLPWTILSVAVPILLAPIITCILTLGYYDLRVRREGFDLQLLSQQLGSV